MICLLAVKTGMPRVYPNILYVYIPENRWAFIVKVLSLIVRVWSLDPHCQGPGTWGKWPRGPLTAHIHAAVSFIVIQ